MCVCGGGGGCGCGYVWRHLQPCAWVGGCIKQPDRYALSCMHTCTAACIDLLVSDSLIQCVLAKPSGLTVHGGMHAC